MTVKESWMSFLFEMLSDRRILKEILVFECISVTKTKEEERDGRRGIRHKLTSQLEVRGKKLQYYDVEVKYQLID